ncbi:MAG TPA: AbiA family abortive infection protein [Tenuifilaceae bacterium]|nr:AbiA family abortive infection protein [Tenuifilaceae bacterium]
MTDLKKIQTGHFLTFETWTSAKKLLDYQIKDKINYKTYNTLNFHYFDTIKGLTKKVGEKTYYKERVSNNLFYGLEREFFFHKYTVPKTGIGLRSYYFFSYPMQQMVYAFGLYLLRVSQQYLTDKKSANIKSHYGGDLKFDTGTGELVLNKNTTLYYSHYHKFKKELVDETANPNNKVFLRLDIQNYFDNISIGKLLNLLEQNVKPSELNIHKFDSSTKEQIEFFYRFISNGTDNIPQSDNNIISNFISHLYLTFGDFIIEDAIVDLNREYKIVNGFKIIRYVDDIYISIDFREITIFEIEYTEDNRNGFIYQLLNKIADEFYQQLNLRFNGKAELFRINKLDEKEKLLDLIKKVSEDYPEPSSEKDIAVDDKVNRLLGLIDIIKAKDVSQVYKDLSKQESETLKDIYDKSVLGLISTAANITRLESRFSDFNFDLLRVYPQPLIIMITLCPTAKVRLENYLLSKVSLTTFDRGLLVVLLCQSNFANIKLFEKLQVNEQLKPIFEFMRFKKVVDNKNTGYYKVDLNKMKVLTKQVSFIEQIRQRVYTERQGHYSVALNHLLNEVHLACCVLEGKDIKTYKEPNVDTYLTTKGLDNPTRTKISNLFNRRNNNPISHPGSDSRVAWAVEKTEYSDYKINVAKTMETISQ